uniref:Uncharacterized protein n=1 Tax=Arundo donax TaxID=35708 RepID=A0A0A9CLU7_ARUDO
MSTDRTSAIKTLDVVGYIPNGQCCTLRPNNTLLLNILMQEQDKTSLQCTY